MKIYTPLRLAYVASGLSIAILVLFGLLYMENSHDQLQYIDAVEGTYKVLSTINFCEKKLVEAESAQRGYLLTDTIGYRDIFENTLPMIDSSMNEIDTMTADHPGQSVYFTQLRKFVTAKTQLLQANLNLKDTDPLYSQNLRDGEYVMENCRRYMAKMRSTEENLLRERLDEKIRHQGVNFSFFKATFITSCLICIIALGIFFRELRTRLKVQKNLKAKVSELSNSKRELEEMTFAASHDLQEPMRKVRILTNLVTKKLQKKIPEEEIEVIQRINKITEQMHGLLTDLVSYTNLLNPNEQYADILLHDVFKNAYQKVFKNNSIQFTVSEKLPAVNGSRLQLESMLTHILENALKFKSADRELVINVKYELKKVGAKQFREQLFLSGQYHLITISDNGIGFENQYGDKIFGLFQRLHTQTEYPGKGSDWRLQEG